MRKSEVEQRAIADLGDHILVIGTKDAAAGFSFGTEIDLVQTTSVATTGEGPALYVHDALADDAFAAAFPLATFTAADGRVFRLVSPVSLEAFGGQPGRDFDNVPALRAALSYLEGLGRGILSIGAGDFEVASASLIRPLVVPSHVKIRGAGRRHTRLIVTGVTQTSCLFSLNNHRDITLSDITMVGNGMATGDNNGVAIWAYLLTDIADDMVNLSLERIRLENFKGPYWIAFGYNFASTYNYSDILLDDVEAISRAGNSIDPSAVTRHAHVVQVSGYVGPIDRVRIKNFYCEATHIKGGIFITNQTRDVVIEKASIKNAGLVGAADDAAAYAICCYDSNQLGMRDITINDVVLTNPRSCGIYLAAGRNISILGPKISGQTDTLSATLPKGAVAVNGTIDCRVIGGLFVKNVFDIKINPHNTEPRLNFLAKGFISRDVKNTSVSVSYAPYLADTYDVEISNAKITSTASLAKGVAMQNAAGYRVNNVVIDECRIDVPNIGIDHYNDAASAATGYEIRNCTVRGANGGIRVREQTGRTLIDNCKISSASGIACSVYDCDNVTVRNIDCFDAAVGFDARLTTGTISGVSITNCVTPVLSASLGLTIPSHRAPRGSFVQNLAPTTSSVQGWVNIDGATGWKSGRVTSHGLSPVKLK